MSRPAAVSNDDRALGRCLLCATDVMVHLAARESCHHLSLLACRNVTTLAGALSKRGEDGIEIVNAGVLDDDAALAFSVFDGDFEAERAAEVVLGFADVGVLNVHWFGFGFGLGFGMEQALDVVLGASDGEMEGQNLLRGSGDGFGGFEREEGASMAEGELAGLDIKLDR